MMEETRWRKQDGGNKVEKTSWRKRDERNKKENVTMVYLY